MISASVTPLERFISAMTSAFLLVRSPLSRVWATFFGTAVFLASFFGAAALAVFLALGAAFVWLARFFEGAFSGATSAAGCATSPDRRCTAVQMRATAALRSVNFLTGLSS